ncbi:MAG: PAS domain-containing sensor histidine kinase, partial [Betaproteobacteria bacterium]|nr:PAS domain-containing sensor histidine kinase [Betaproteobacteria bacterium]
METLSLRDRDEEKRSLTRVLRAVLVLAIGLAGVLLLALSAATRNTQFFTDYYPVLLWSAVALGLVLLLLLAELLRRLISRLHRGLFGSRLMARMAVIFVLLAVAPAALMFYVSVQFIERSVESWFDVPVERALDSGLSLARVSLDSRLQRLLQDAKQSAQQLDPNAGLSTAAQLERLRVRLGASELQLLSASGKLIASANESTASFVP